MTNEYPEFSKKYPAIDGITKDERPSKETRAELEKASVKVSFSPAENAVRSDVEEILEMGSGEFHTWYRIRKGVTVCGTEITNTIF